MNKITCICLGVRNMRNAVKFYRDGLGFKAQRKISGDKLFLLLLHHGTV